RGEEVQLLDQLEAGGCRIDRQPSLPPRHHLFDQRWRHRRIRHIGEAADHAPGGAAAQLFENRNSSHHAAPMTGCRRTGTAMAMPSFCQTTSASTTASKAIAVTMPAAAPHRPSRGMRIMLMPTLTTRA